VSKRAASTTRRLVEIPIGAGLTTLAPGLAALAAHSVLLFPSLGPTALMQAHAPQHESSHPYNVVVGHAVGLGSAFLFVWLFGLAHAPSVFEVHAVWASRVWATVLAIMLAALLEVALKAAHPPAASTTLLASLGSFKPTWGQTAQVAIGVAIVAIVGEGVRRYRIRDEQRAAAERAA
jgi:hypothetical protein